MTSIAQIQAEHKALVADFNTNNEVGVMVEFTDPKESETITLKTIAPAYNGSAIKGGTGYVPAVTEDGEPRDLPIVFVVAIAPVEVEEQVVVAEEPAAIEEAAKPVLSDIPLMTGTSLKAAKPEEIVVKKTPPVKKLPTKKDAPAKEEKPEAAKTVSTKRTVKPKESIGDKRTGRRISQIKISNIMGVEELEIDLNGNATMISGKNGEGKSSITKAILTTIAGGYPAELIRNGEESGEVVLVIDDDEMSIRKKISNSKAGKTQLKVDGKTVPRAQSKLNALFDNVATDPAKFLSSKPASQLEQLLEATPMSLSEDQINTLTSALAANIQTEKPDLDLHPIKILDACMSKVNSNRLSLGTQLNTEKAGLSRLKDTLPDNIEPKELSEVEERLAQLKEHSLGLTAKSNIDIDHARTKQKEIIESARLKTDEQNKELIDRKAELHQQQLDIKAELSQIDVTLENADLEFKRGTENVDNQANNKVQQISNQLSADQNAVENDICATELAIRNHSQYTMTLNHIKNSEVVAADLQQQRTLSEQYLEKLGDIKGSLLTSIPIDGLEVENGSIVCEGVPFKMLNTAKQAELAIRIAVMRLDTNPEAIRLVIIDGVECMDSETTNALLDAAEENNVQIVMAKTTDAPLTITEAKVA